jgi:Uma2 family endonuclease
MASRAPERMTLATFLASGRADRRYQLIGGVPVIRVPASAAHDALTARLMLEIGSRLQRSCRVVGEARITVPDRIGTCYVADLAVTCAPREPDQRTVTRPVLIVEVLSPKVGGVRKVADYQTLPSVNQILIAFHDERRVSLLNRVSAGWRVEDLTGKAEIRLSCCADPIPLEAIYRDLVPGPGEPQAVPSGA